MNAIILKGRNIMGLARRVDTASGVGEMKFTAVLPGHAFPFILLIIFHEHLRIYEESVLRDIRVFA